MKRLVFTILFAAASVLAALPIAATAQGKLVVKPLVEKKVAELPAGTLFWRLENFATVDAARAAASQWALVAETAGKVWLFTLGPKGPRSPGATLVAEVGPLPKVVATEYLLRINEGSGPPGSITAPHSHPGSEAFYVIKGETTSHTPHGQKRIAAGKTETGHGPDTPMRVSSTGDTDLHSLVMFVVDANKPFSTPVARFP